MCLYIKPEIHYKNSLPPQPVKTTKNIEVYKIVCKKSTGDIVTPFQYMELKFSNGKCVLPMLPKGKFIQIEHTTYMSPEILYAKKEFGYHSYIDFSVASRMITSLGLWFNPFFEEVLILRAIIPAGSWVWYGIKGDICSNQLTIISKENTLHFREEK